MAELAWVRRLFDPGAVLELLQKEEKMNKASRYNGVDDYSIS